MWAESYDRELKDIFAVQDEIRQKIVLALKVKLTAEEQERFRRTPTANLEAYEYVLRGFEALYRYTKAATSQARLMFERPWRWTRSMRSRTLLGWSYYFEWAYQWSEGPQAIERAFTLAQRLLPWMTRWHLPIHCWVRLSLAGSPV